MRDGGASGARPREGVRIDILCLSYFWGPGPHFPILELLLPSLRWHTVGTYRVEESCSLYSWGLCLHLAGEEMQAQRGTAAFAVAQQVRCLVRIEYVNSGGPIITIPLLLMGLESFEMQRARGLETLWVTCLSLLFPTDREDQSILCT